MAINATLMIVMGLAQGFEFWATDGTVGRAEVALASGCGKSTTIYSILNEFDPLQQRLGRIQTNLQRTAARVTK